MLALRALFACSLVFSIAACGAGGESGAAGAGAATGVGGASSTTTSSSGSGGATSSGGSSTSSSSSSSGELDGGTDAAPPCTLVDALGTVTIAVAATADEHALTLTAISASPTSWAEPGNEALILEVSGASGLIGHLVLHQGKTAFAYGMQVGALAAGDSVKVRVSALSANAATKQACVSAVSLTPASALGAAGEGLVNAPILEWPVEKRFDDLPIVLGWSKAKQEYQLVYTNENGGTVAQCGGGATGMQTELARWGRGCDIERIFSYGGAVKQWERCDGMTGYDVITPRAEAAHPILYYGDGHNRLFESRGGYGKTCGTGSPEKADGDLAGWGTQSPGDEAAKDAPFVVILRPLPAPLDPLGYAKFGGRREALVDTYAPWLYRVTFSELEREGKLDQSHTFAMQQYAYVDVHAADVGGSGDSYCSFTVSGGFVLRLHTTTQKTLSGPQMTASYFGGADAVKRVAVPLDAVTPASQFDAVVFDAYDKDGMYWLELGDAFIARPDGDNGAKLEYLHLGQKKVDVYVDDDSSGCVGGANSGGPGGLSYPCVGSFEQVPLP